MLNLIKLIVGIKLKTTYRFNSNQSVKLTKRHAKTPFKKRFSVFSQRWLNLKRVQIFAFLYTL
ncbi:hypothetical protein C2R85_06035 [Helicobacter pylori]|nr:hypothetical protein C2R85_06035 [Helicobacter pylori]